jgi:hypothetical protein
MTGLHINYAKSTVVPIHMDEQQACVQILGCRRDQERVSLRFIWVFHCQMSTHTTYTPYIHKTDKYLAIWQAHLLNKNASSSIGERDDGQPVGVLHELSTLATISNPGIHVGRR